MHSHKMNRSELEKSLLDSLANATNAIISGVEGSNLVKRNPPRYVVIVVAD